MPVGPCSSCAFFDPPPDSKRGLCRATAPRFANDGKARWPDCDETDWCGSYEAKPAAQEPPDDQPAA